MSTTTRRAILAGAPAVAAGTLAVGTGINAVAVAMTRSTETDPVLAVIREHREAKEELRAACAANDLHGGLRHRRRDHLRIRPRLAFRVITEEGAHA
jgi:hypothetical protein